MKKVFSLIGLGSGILVIVFGVLLIAGVLGGYTYLPADPSLFYDYGYGTFGTDFYTYVVNNTYMAALTCRSAASNIAEAVKVLKCGGGILIIAFGLFLTCFFGMKCDEWFKIRRTSNISHETVFEEKPDDNSPQDFPEKIADES